MFTLIAAVGLLESSIIFLGVRIKFLLSPASVYSPDPFRMLVLPGDREDPDLLKEARDLLDIQAVALGVPREKMPQPPRTLRAPSASGAGESSQGTTAAFDPYKVWTVMGFQPRGWRCFQA